jgi:hypothetical protein
MPIGLKLTHLDGVLPQGEIHVWHTRLDLSEEPVNRLLPLLDSGEQARAARFLVADARKQYVISHAFLRIALGQYLHIEPQAVRFCTTGNGKPELAEGSELRFNLSHTEGTAGRPFLFFEGVRMAAITARFPASPRFLRLLDCKRGVYQGMWGGVVHGTGTLRGDSENWEFEVAVGNLW